MLTAEQIRAARGLLRWSARQLGIRAGIHMSTIQRLERGDGPVHASVTTVGKIESAFEGAGIEFLDDAKGLGVRLKPDHRRQRRHPDRTPAIGRSSAHSGTETGAN